LEVSFDLYVSSTETYPFDLHLKICVENVIVFFSVFWSSVQGKILTQNCSPLLWITVFKVVGYFCSLTVVLDKKDILSYDQLFTTYNAFTN